jgi:phage terminase large subunit
LKLVLQDIIGKGYKDFWQTKKRYRILKGGRGSKKSCNTAINFVWNLMKYTLANLLVVRKVYDTHRNSTFAQLKWAIEKLQVSHLWKCTVSPMEITYIPTGQKIIFIGMDKVLNATSITVAKGVLCWVWFEEMFQITTEDEFNKIDTSIRGEVPKGYWKQITGTLNPWNEKHWIKRRFFDNPCNETFTLTNNYQCNEWLDNNDRALFEEMKERNPRRYKVEGLGEWGTAEGLIYDNFIEQEFDYLELLKDTDNKPANGLDFGYTAHPTAFISCLINSKEKEIYIYDEHYEKGMQNDKIYSMLNYKGFAKDKIIADSEDPKSIDELKYLGIRRIEKAKKGQGSVNAGIQFIQQHKLIVHPKCINTIFELNNYSWKQTNGITINEPTKENDHLMDALRYALEPFSAPKRKTISVGYSLAG